MSPDKLTPLQKRLLRALAALEPPWTLTGGGALAGVYLGHRTTRDLDLFWRGRAVLESTAADATGLLRANGIDVTVLRSSPTFAQLRASDGSEVCIIDLVAEPLPPVTAPQKVAIEGIQVAVDTLHEIFVGKLTALLGRTEVRDLEDVRALLQAGGDLAVALRDAPLKDAGSPSSRSPGCSRASTRDRSRWRLAGANRRRQRSTASGGALWRHSLVRQGPRESRRLPHGRVCVQRCKLTLR